MTDRGAEPQGGEHLGLMIGPLYVQFWSNSIDLAARIRQRFGMLPAAGPSEANTSIPQVRVLECPDAMVPEVRVPDRTLFSFRDGLRGWYDAGTLYMAAPGVHVVSVPAEGWARLTVSRACLVEKPEFITHTLVTFVVFELLRHWGLYHLHAAALVTDGRGLIIAGPTGGGKTSMAVSLVRRGLRCVADDTLFVQARGDATVVYGLPEEFTLDPEAAARFPELATLRDRPPCGDAQKRRFDPREFYGDVFARECAPQVLVFSSPGERERTSLTRLSPAEALVRAVPLTPLVMLDRSIAGCHVEAIRQLVQSCTCYALSAGTDLRQEPWRLLDMVRLHAS